MKSTFLLVCLALAFVFFSGCQKNEPYVDTPGDPAYLHRCVKQLTDVIVHDIFSPPVAARIYTYASAAGYETAVQGYIQMDSTEYTSLAGKYNDLPASPAPPAKGTWDVSLASVHAFLIVGKALIFSEDTITAFQDKIYVEIKQQRNIPEDIYENSMAYGQQVAGHIMAWSSRDNYKQTRTFPKYSITDDPSKWQPTPPAYMDGIEPNWSKIRPFVLDSAAQFAPKPPTPFSTDTNSQFYKEAMEVYTAQDTAHEDFDSRMETASFWDCNPYVSHQHGHVMFATKKITPGGHWMSITRQACIQNKLSFIETARTYAFVSVTLVDGFISCWDEKYRSNLVRPETYINNYIDPVWRPKLQTPPFPEHTSGHSVVSSAVGEVLTTLIGDNIAYTDSTEVEFGLPMRNFTSFRHAYHEAAFSRMYGGIHYRPAIEYGVDQGKQIGEFMIERLVEK